MTMGYLDLQSRGHHVRASLRTAGVGHLGFLGTLRVWSGVDRHSLLWLDRGLAQRTPSLAVSSRSLEAEVEHQREWWTC